MKKLLLILFLAVSILTPSFVFAEDNVIGAGEYKVTMQAPDTPFLKFENIFKSLFDIAITVSEIIFILLFLAGGVMYLTSAGSDDQVANARKLMLNGVIGLVIVLASWAIGNWVLDLLHGRYTGGGGSTVDSWTNSGPGNNPSVGLPKTENTTPVPPIQNTPTVTIPTPTNK